MKHIRAYIEHPGRVVDSRGKFEHLMAITLDPRTGNRDGVIRCITSREGDLQVRGNIDRSKLYRIQGESLEYFNLTEPLKIKKEEEIISKLAGTNDFLGLEDPDIWIDERNDLVHLYFTMPVKTGEHRYDISLGHACGRNLDSLVMTEPVLVGSLGKSAKELSVAPVNSRRVRLNLIESSLEDQDNWCSTVRVVIAEDMGKPWVFGETIFNPLETDKKWITGHASPGPLLPRSFLDVGENRLLGIINGREANQKVGDEIRYGMFSVGLFIYDYENGKIDWVSPKPLIMDSEAKTITFASQFVETKPGEGILYAHVDDSFVRAYTLFTDGIKNLLPAAGTQ